MTWFYMIREGETGPIKIGRSSDPWKRLDALQSGNARQLVLICAYKVGKAAHIFERNAHREFASHRLIGEWFEPVEQLIQMATDRGLPACERCQSDQKRLHVWAKEYGVDPIALCFRCTNSAEVDEVRKKEATEARQKAAREAEFQARQLAKGRN